ncbi:DNA-3-methyladenine glycosylase [Candidatus Woesearchaeota archaeon]|nr:DNA-3-methyladenine glycosylase [Candidatus Woesearchaeota archaeon]
MKLLSEDFFLQDAVDVARQLLGCVISYDGCSGVIVETEAYKNDAASHAFRRTARSEIMFLTSGCWYIYFVYGMYHCMNITTNGIGQPGAVLIRALQPLEGIDIMKKRRKTDDVYNLLSGPGKVCDAFGVDKKLNGTTVHGVMRVFEGKLQHDIIALPRVGIRVATELPWRFCVKDNKFVSRL